MTLLMLIYHMLCENFETMFSIEWFLLRLADKVETFGCELESVDLFSVDLLICYSQLDWG